MGPPKAGRKKLIFGGHTVRPKGRRSPKAGRKNICGPFGEPRAMPERLLAHLMGVHPPPPSGEKGVAKRRIRYIGENQGVWCACWL